MRTRRSQKGSPHERPKKGASPKWGRKSNLKLVRFWNQTEPFLVQKWVQVPSPFLGQNPSQKWGRKAYPNLGRPLRMRAGSYSERAFQIWVRFSSPFLGRISAQKWGRNLDPLLNQNWFQSISKPCQVGLRKAPPRGEVALE